MSKTKKRHIAEIYLDRVGIRYSRRYFSETVEANPLHNTLEGVRRILLDFNIRSKGLTLSREEMLNMVDPFITTLPDLFNGFVLITQATDNSITILSEQGGSKEIDINDYIAAWDGNILFPEVTEKSDEPDYCRNLVLSITDSLKMPFTLIVTSALVGIFFARNILKEGVLFSSFLLMGVYCAGMVVCGLLLMESLNIYNPVIRKVCHSGRKMSCSKVLESKHSKFLGIVGWSEIGLIYFSGSLLFFLSFPQYASVLFPISVLALPYIVWSVAYQWFIVKNWCVLCLTAQALLLAQFVVFISNSASLRLDDITVPSLAIYILCCIVPAIALWWIISWISKANERNQYRQMWSSLKFNEDVSSTLIAKSAECDLVESARQVVLGNKNAKHKITIISNPYCHHCASLHTRLIRFLELNDDFKAEIILVGESPIEGVIKKLISAYFVYDVSQAGVIFSEWYKSYEKVFDRFVLDTYSETVNDVYRQCTEWYDRKKPIGTPSIFINDKLLPEGYVLEDLRIII